VERIPNPGFRSSVPPGAKNTDGGAAHNAVRLARLLNDRELALTTSGYFERARRCGMQENERGAAYGERRLSFY